MIRGKWGRSKRQVGLCIAVLWKQPGILRSWLYAVLVVSCQHFPPRYFKYHMSQWSRSKVGWGREDSRLLGFFAGQTEPVSSLPSGSEWMGWSCPPKHILAFSSQWSYVQGYTRSGFLPGAGWPSNPSSRGPHPAFLTWSESDLAIRTGRL